MLQCHEDSQNIVKSLFASLTPFFSKLWCDSQYLTTDSCLAGKNTSEMTIHTHVAK